MRKTSLLACLAFIFVACNDNSQSSTAASDSAKHSTHTANNNQAIGNNHMKHMHDAMNSMMQQMQGMKPSGNPDYDFAMMMKHHHEGAVEMARSEVAGGTDEALKQMAQKMINDQQSEIAVFNKLLQESPPAGNSDFGQRSMEMMTPMNEIKMESGSLDAMFASMMIPHHQDAVDMSQEYIKVSKNPDLKKVAQNIISSQQKEIQELRAWLENQKN